MKLWRQESWPFGPGWAANIARIRSWTFRLPCLISHNLKYIMKTVTFCNLDKKERSLTYSIPFHLLDLSFRPQKCTHSDVQIEQILCCKSWVGNKREKKGKPVWNLFFQFFLMLMDLRSREFGFLYAASKIEILYESALLLWCTFTFTHFSRNIYPPKILEKISKCSSRNHFPSLSANDNYCAFFILAIL